MLLNNICVDFDIEFLHVLNVFFLLITNLFWVMLYIKKLIYKFMVIFFFLNSFPHFYFFLSYIIKLFNLKQNLI